MTVILTANVPTPQCRVSTKQVRMRCCTNGQCSDTTVQSQYERGKDDCYTNGQCSDTTVQSQYETGKDEVLY